MTRPHLLVAISSHGFGHVAQVAPVLNALTRLRPDLRITLRTAAPYALLASRICPPFEHRAVADDFGMVQRDALRVDVAASAARYREFHAAWEARVEALAKELAEGGFDLLLADVPYLTLAAAARAGLTAYALCSLHWADIYSHYCGTTPEGPRIAAQMLDAYRSARLFLRPAPSMPMDDLLNSHAVGPIATAGVNRRAELTERHRIGPGERLVLVALGGIATRLPAERWPSLPGVRWIFQRAWEVARPDALVLEELGLGFADLLASVDLLFTKPGYGSFAEAAAAGVPVLFVERPDWPEAPWLAEWLRSHGRCIGIDPARAAEGDFAAPLQALLEQGRPPPVAATGVDEVAALLAEALSATTVRRPDNR